ncbi:MAG: glycosyltransferase family 2 protein [Nitrospirota bacterium]
MEYTSPPTIKEYRALPPHPNRTEGGLRLNETSDKTSRPGKPLVSIVTIVFNGEKTLEKTIQSVLGQTYENIEHIIIDGGSTDGTLKIIRQYNDKIAYWLSEPDNGIYDAMNKGVSLATGEWINFMNVGDTFYEPDTVKKVFSSNYGKADIIYGNNEIIYGSELSVIRKALDITELWKGMIVNHQSMFVKTSLMQKHPFNLDYKIGADYNFIYSAYMDKCEFCKIETVISSTAHGGYSDLNVIPNIKEQWMIVRRHNASFKIDLYYIWLILYAFIKNIMKIILPEKIREVVIKRKYK